MKEAIRDWWDGNSTRLWRMLLIAWIGTLSFLGGYVFKEVAEVPKVYAEKEQVRALATEMRHGFECIGGKVDEVNRYLRDKR